MLLITAPYQTFATLPKYVGGYHLVDFVVNLQKKPCWLHRTMMRLCLGWEWKDFDDCGKP